MAVFRTCLALLFTLAAASAQNTGSTPPRLAGFWQGTLKPGPDIELRLSLEIKEQPDGKLTGSLVSLDQSPGKMPVTAQVKEGGQVELQVPSVGGQFTGQFNATGEEIAGEWQQSGKLPLTFKRAKKPAVLKRPQEPARPYPYEAMEVRIENAAAKLKLAGTLTLPKQPGPHPAVVLITGSGAQDRDESLMGHRPFLVLADHLTRQGIAVLRYDDRGTAKSTGNFARATHNDFVEDALAAMNWLKARKEIDPKRIGLIGHSEGATEAPIAAVKQPDDIAFVVMLAGVGVPFDELLVRQAADLGKLAGQSQEDIERGAISQRALYSLLKEAKDDAAAAELVRNLAAFQMMTMTPAQREAAGQQISMAASPWFRQLLIYDPKATLRQVKCPVLAINGSKDVQVAAGPNLKAIREALTEGGNTQIKITELPGLNHLFQTCEKGGPGEYGKIEETFAPSALNMISDWIRQTTGL